MALPKSPLPRQKQRGGKEMKYENLKIQPSEIRANGVVSAPDRLSGTAAENKAVFDRLIKNVVAEKFNSFIEQVMAEIESIEVPPKGEPGYSPVKGVDYWTEEEQAEIESSVIEELSKTKTAASVTLTAEGWADKRQTVNFNSVTADSIVIVSPAPAEENFKAYADCEVRCASQSEGALTFVCEEVPDIALIVNVAVFN